MREFKIGDRSIGLNYPPFVIAEMSGNHNHSLDRALKIVEAAAEAGADIVRVSAPDESSARALKQIVAESPVPIVADIHFHYQRGIEAADNGAACLRINPGNIGGQARVREVVKAARANGCSIRIGVNAGSLEKELAEARMRNGFSVICCRIDKQDYSTAF